MAPTKGPGNDPFFVEFISRHEKEMETPVNFHLRPPPSTNFIRPSVSSAMRGKRSFGGASPFIPTELKDSSVAFRSPAPMTPASAGAPERKCDSRVFVTPRTPKPRKPIPSSVPAKTPTAKRIEAETPKMSLPQQKIEVDLEVRKKWRERLKSMCFYFDNMDNKVWQKYAKQVKDCGGVCIVRMHVSVHLLNCSS